MDNTVFNLAAYLEDLEEIVNYDSGSNNPEGVAQVADFFARKFAAMGWQVKQHNFNAAVGPCLEITNTGSEPYDVLLMGHMDTVFKAGTTTERPFAVKGDKAFGPGIIDMKAGLLSIYYVLHSLHVEEKLGGLSVCAALTCDEEISSIYTRPWLEELSRKSATALILEPARADGNLVNKRKGVGRYKIEITGLASHSGVDHEKGRSAIQELAEWILALHGKTNYQKGTTVNVGVVTGGTGVNVVADRASAEVDLRFSDLREAEAVEALMRQMIDHPKTPGVTAKVSGGVTRPPMNPTEKTLRLCEKVEEIAAELGIPIGWTATGGGSDGCFSANLGIPTIDGLGPVGAGQHGINEFVLINTIKPRFNLLRRIIQELAVK